MSVIASPGLRTLASYKARWKFKLIILKSRSERVPSVANDTWFLLYCCYFFFLILVSAHHSPLSDARSHAYKILNQIWRRLIFFHFILFGMTHIQEKSKRGTHALNGFALLSFMALRHLDSCERIVSFFASFYFILNDTQIYSRNWVQGTLQNIRPLSVQ